MKIKSFECPKSIRNYVKKILGKKNIQFKLDLSPQNFRFDVLYFLYSGFLQRILQDFLKKKNNTWNIRRLVDESFVPLAQRTNISNCRLTDF